MNGEVCDAKLKQTLRLLGKVKTDILASILEGGQ